MKLIFGLGNPGKDYENTRHNAGFLSIDRLAEMHGISLNECKWKGLCGKGIIRGEKVVLVKPQTFMNNSGECVRAVLDFYKADPATDLMVIYDDIDLEPGQLRIRKQGSAGSHNGMKSVVSHVGSPAFPRIRVGVGSKPAGWDLADYVLAHPAGAEKEAFLKGAERAAEAVTKIIADGMDSAMNTFNRKEEKEG